MSHVFVSPAKGWEFHRATEFIPVSLKWQATAVVGSIEHMLAEERAPLPLPAPTPMPRPLPAPYWSAEAESYATQNVAAYRGAPVTKAVVWLTVLACCVVFWCGVFVAVPVIGGWLQRFWR